MWILRAPIASAPRGSLSKSNAPPTPLPSRNRAHAENSFRLPGQEDVIRPAESICPCLRAGDEPLVSGSKWQDRDPSTKIRLIQPHAERNASSRCAGFVAPPENAAIIVPCTKGPAAAMKRPTL
jgi:hypothetical protein